MAALDAIVDHFLHPDIPLFHYEHLIIGGVTAAVTALLLGIIFHYMKHLEQSIADLKKKEKELRTEQNKLKSILNVMESGMTIRNRDYKLTYQNNYVTNIFGDHIGEKCHRAFQGLDDICDGCPVEKAFHDGETHSSIRKVITPKEETTFWENTAVPIKNAAGEVDSCLEINNNITERKNIENKIFEIEKLEQGRIGRDLHDDLGQILTGVSFKAKVLRDKIANKLPAELDDIEEILRYLNDCKERTRMLAQGLMSLDTEEWNLARSLQGMAQNTEKIFQISCEFKCNNLNTIYDYSTGTHLYRIAQEAVTNAVKHARPEHLEISLYENNGKSKLTIKDDGTGNIDQLIKSAGSGMHIMNYRADIIGASLDIQSDRESGTQVTCVLTSDKK
jgi:signal transduction histidine kinase